MTRLLFLILVCTASELIAQPKFIPIGDNGPLHHQELDAGPNGELYARGPSLQLSMDEGKTWSVQGTFPHLQGTIDLEIAPNGDLYAGGYSAIHRSIDRGQSWIRIDSQFTLQQRGLFAVTGNRVIAHDGYKLCISTDQGQSWDFTDESAYYYYVSPQNVEYRYGSSGWQQSTDEGSTWKPFFSEQVYLAFGKGGELFGYADSTVSISTNGGISWNRQSLPEVLPYPKMQIDSNGTAYIYSTYGQGSLWRSTNAGVTWERIPLKRPPLQKNLCATPWGKVYTYSEPSMYTVETGEAVEIASNLSSLWIRTIAGDDSGRLWLSTAERTTGRPFLFMSTDEGVNWRQTVTDAQPYSINDLEPAGSRIWAAVSIESDTAWPTGIYVSGDLGKTWTVAHKIVKDTVVYAILEEEGVVLAATNPSGILRSTDGGISWRESNAGITNGAMTDIISDNTGRIIAASGNGIFISRDKGETWKRSDIRFPNPRISTIAVDAIGRILAGTPEGLYRTADEHRWERVFIGLLDWEVASLAIDPSDNIIAGGAYDATVYLSSDLGTNWTRFAPFRTGTYEYLSDLWADKGGYVFAGTRAGLFRTDVKLGMANVARAKRQSTNYVTYTVRGFRLQLEENTTVASFRVVDQAGRYVLECTGNPRAIEDALNEKLYGHRGWYGYQLRNGEDIHTGAFIIAH